MKTEHLENIGNIRYTRMGSLIISTKEVEYAVDMSRIVTFLGIEVPTRVIWENISNRFLLFNIPVTIPLADIGQEISEGNNLQILGMHGFRKPDSTNEVFPLLVTVLGTHLPSKVKIWLTIQKIRQFIDCPRQCKKCFNYNLRSQKCKSEQICVNCSVQHTDTCTNNVKCVNCGNEHS